MREYCSLMTSWRSCFERGVGGDGHDVGPRRHHFAHHFVAELHHRLDQLAVFLLDQPLFGAGGDQRFDVLGGRGLFFLLAGVVGQVDQRLEELEQRHERARRSRPCPRSSGASGSSQRADVRRYSSCGSGIGYRQHDQPRRQRRLPESRRVHGSPSANQAKQKTPSSTSSVCLMSENAAAPCFGLQPQPVFQRLLEELERGQVARAQPQAFQVQQAARRSTSPSSGMAASVASGDRQHHARTRSIRPPGSPSRARQRFSARAMRPPIGLVIHAQQVQQPVQHQDATSCSMACPNSRAWARARASEMAISPSRDPSRVGRGRETRARRWRNPGRGIRGSGGADRRRR